MANLLPAIFFGHGNPMNAVMKNAYTDAWRRIGEDTERPRASLSISAHWFVPGPRYDQHCAEDHPRLRRISARVVYRAISGSW
jgi:aromatic ring-opening dioxygenase catalytic subunit (LigB family)